MKKKKAIIKKKPASEGTKVPVSAVEMQAVVSAVAARQIIEQQIQKLGEQYRQADAKLEEIVSEVRDLKGFGKDYQLVLSSELQAEGCILFQKRKRGSK